MPLPAQVIDRVHFSPVGKIRVSTKGRWSHVDAKDLAAFLCLIAGDHLTGELTIHFSGGTPSGMLEWKQKE